MRSAAIAFILIAGLAAGQNRQKQPSETGPGAGVRTIVGLVDQVESSFVIADEDEVRPIATLKGEGFADENFARYVGMRVSVRGRLTGEGDRKVLHVRRLEDIVKLEPPSKQE